MKKIQITPKLPENVQGFRFFVKPSRPVALPPARRRRGRGRIAASAAAAKGIFVKNRY